LDEDTDDAAGKDRPGLPGWLNVFNCRSLHTETVDGQVATIYAAPYLQTTAQVSSSDYQIWISNAIGLPLKTEAVTQAGDRKMHVSIRFDQGNAQPPAGVN
jgi:hypothetical protein